MSFDLTVADALERLDDWPVGSAPNQPGLRRRYLDELRHHGTAALIKGQRPSHLTASVLVLDEAGEQVLLTHHRKAELWLQFGGHIESRDETLTQAARREGSEESGIELAGPLLANRLDAHLLSGGFSCDEHLDVQFVTRIARTAPVVSDESLDVRWFAVDDLPDQLGGSVAEQVRVALGR